VTIKIPAMPGTAAGRISKERGGEREIERERERERKKEREREREKLSKKGFLILFIYSLNVHG
jgi:hypothetical protein